MKVTIIGASGLIGWDLYKTFSAQDVDLAGTYHTHPKPGMIKGGYQDISDELIKGADYVVLCGAITDISKCAADKELSEYVNVVTTKEVLIKCKTHNACPVFLSSDYVFDGAEGNYTEEHPKSPTTVYGRQKAEVEDFIAANFSDFYIFRLSKTYSVNLDERSLFSEIYSSLANNRKVFAAVDQYFNFTNVEYVSQVILSFLASANRKFGLYNLAKDRIVSRHSLICATAKLFGFDETLIQPIHLNDLPFSEVRPLNTALNCEKLARTMTPLQGTKP